MPYSGNREPPLDEVFADHIVHLVMARDRLVPEEVRAQMEAARHQLRQRRDSRAYGRRAAATKERRKL
jgi:hypothetical protein